MIPTAFVALLRWEVAGIHGGEITKIKLTDGETAVPFSAQLQADIEKAMDRQEDDLKSAPIIMTMCWTSSAIGCRCAGEAHRAASQMESRRTEQGQRRRL